VIELRVLTPDDWSVWRELRLLALAESPDAFGSRLADWQGPGDTESRWRERLESVAHNVIAVEGGQPVGMVSGVDEGEQVELISMYVRPSARGRGVSDALVAAVAEWAQARGAARVSLSVRVDNIAAKRLYRRHGFVEAGPAPGRPGEPSEVLMTATLD
jgi:ribosomal protein S18 acetylase RimI-like enzyme